MICGNTRTAFACFPTTCAAGLLEQRLFKARLAFRLISAALAARPDLGCKAIALKAKETMASKETCFME
jgi:hypothetical protein